MDKVSDNPPVNNSSVNVSNHNKKPLVSKPILIGILVFIIILSVSGSVLFLQGRLSFSQLPFTKRFLPMPSPAPVSKNIPNVLFPRSPDPSGRNIYYITSDLGKNIKYAGVGILTYPAGTKFTDNKGKVLFTTPVSTDSAMINYIVGSLDRWESIPNSKDKYLILKDLLGVHTEKGEVIPIPKIRIGFNTKDIDQRKNIFGTAFGVEDLSSVIPKVINATEGIKLYRLNQIGLIGIIDPNDLKILIKPGDTIAVTVIADLTKQKDLVDEKGNIVAAWLFIRRFDPKTTLPKELNKPINLL